MRLRILFAVVSLSCLIACARTPLHPRTETSPFIQGRAKVLEVHNALGYALLDIDGKQLYAYWDTDPASGQLSTISSPGGFGQAVGEGKDPIVHHQDLSAQPGDTIIYRGLMTGPDLLLRGVAVLPK
jgi:hypothetical protein